MTSVTAIEKAQRRITSLKCVRWMTFYHRHFPLHYDKNVRTYAPQRHIHRVWFYGNRMNIK